MAKLESESQVAKCLMPSDLEVKSTIEVDRMLKSHDFEFAGEIRSPKENVLVGFEQRCKNCGHGFSFSLTTYEIGVK